jgi:hypothetical protein
VIRVEGVRAWAKPTKAEKKQMKKARQRARRPA